MTRGSLSDAIAGTSFYRGTPLCRQACNTSSRLLATGFLLPLPSNLGRPEDDTSRATR